MIELRDEARATLLELASSEGLDVAQALVIAGNFAGRELHRLTEQPTTGLIVVGSTTRGPIGRLLVGGIGERLLAGAACPVAIAPRGYGERQPSRLTCIGVGFDGSDEARLALGAAVAVARAGRARLRVITAYQRLAFGGVSTSRLAGGSANDIMKADLRACHDEALAEVATRIEVEGRFREGAADEVLLRESQGIDLLVAGSRGYGPLGAVLLGSTTAAIAKKAGCPLLVTPRGTRFDLIA